MKKIRKIVLNLLAISIILSLVSCYGSFNVTRSVYKWNGEATDNKFANSIITWAFIIVPVYEVCAFVDFVVLNTIEFWTGSNPITMTNGESDFQIVNSGENVFKVIATKNRFRIEQIEGTAKGNTVDLIYKPAESAWYIASGLQEFKIAQGDLENKDWIRVFYPDGKMEEIALK